MSRARFSPSNRRRHLRPDWSVSPLEPRLMLAADVGVQSSPTAGGPGPVAESSTVAPAARAVVFVDGSVSELAELAGPIDQGAEIVLLDASKDGVAQITDFLNGRREIQAVHILSHGSAGHLRLGATDLTDETLADHADQIRQWGEALSGNADLLLYGCDVTANESGISLVRRIAHLTGADVAASNDRTGNAATEGDWDLESKFGHVDTPLLFTSQSMRRFGGHLGIEISAAGTVGLEEMELQIGDEVVASWTVTNTGLFEDQFESYFADVDGASINDIRVNFVNSVFDPERNIDENLGVDWIRVDGVQYETESPEVYSTGTWEPGIGIVPGFKQSEILHADGYFDYRVPPTSGGDSTIRIFASGQTGSEQMQLLIDGNPVATFDNVSTESGVYRYDADQFVSVDRIRVQFTNDLFQEGFDRNLTVDRIEVNGTTYESEAPEVFASALWVEGLGVVSGNFQQQTLNVNGYFQYSEQGGGGPSEPTGPTADGLIGYWRLDDSTASGTILDASGLEIEGTPKNFVVPDGPTSDRPDLSGNSGAFSFDGVNDVIEVGPDEALRLNSGTYTQSLWIQPTTAVNAFRGVIGYQVGALAGTRYPFLYTYGDDLYAGFGTGGDTWKGVIAENVIDINQWNHVAITFDGSSMQLYVNGEVVGSNSNFGGSKPTTSVNQFNIGAINNHYAGQIDEVRLYNRALTAEEIQGVRGGTGGTTNPDTNPDTPDPPSNGPGLIGLAETQVTVNENEGSVSVGLRRSNGTSGAAEVFYTTEDGSAFDGVDYFGSSTQSVFFADGQDFATIDIPLIDNGDEDGEKRFNVSLFRVEGAVQGEPRTATVTIVDDESGSGVIGYWDLNEGSPGVISDRSGQGNDGQTVGFNAPNGPTSDRPDMDGFNSGAFSFDGVNDYIDVGTSESLRLTEGTYSQAVWIKPSTNDDNYRGVIGYQEGASVGTRYPFVYTRGDAIYAGFGTGGNTWKGVVADGVITANAWNHVAVSFDGTTMQLFVNGENVGTNSDFGGSLPGQTLAQLNIGRINNQFAGEIDEVYLFDRAISGAEVQNLIDGATLPPPRFVGYFTSETVAGGFFQPTTIERLPNGDFLVAERNGVIRRVDSGGNTASTPFLDINDIVNMVGNDRGLMSIAVAPDFEQSRQIYVAYTYDPPEVQGNGGPGGPDGEGGRVARVSRFTVNESWTVADRNSEVVLVGRNSTYENIGQPNRRPLASDPQSGIDSNGDYIPDFIASDELSHTVGDLEFGTDGALYISTGDGGSYGRVDPINLRALDVNSLNGKILRVDRYTGEGLTDNPFYNGDVNSNASKVYSYGLRNPFRFAVNPNDGEIFIADVGWLNWEEVNTGRGKNFGWPAYEGNGLTGGDRGSYASLPAVQEFLASNPEITPPIYTRSHSSGARAVIMGDFIQGGDYPESLQGAFLFTDIGDRVLRAGRLNAQGELIDVLPVSSSLGFITDVMRMEDGSLYYTDLVSGTFGILRFNV